MKIVVPVKRVIDPYVKIHVKKDGSGVETQHVKMAINPFDEIALEEALRIKEQGIATDVIAVSIGSDASQETLRTALALGADSAILVQTEADFAPLSIAKILQRITEEASANLVLMGKQAIDGDHNQTGQMLAALLKWPQATFASSITFHNACVRVVREIDGGLETLELDLPVVITTDLRLNEPRYATLPNIMKAKRKPLQIMPLDDLGLDLISHIETLSVAPPGQRGAGIKVHDVATLVQKLREEAHVI